MLSKFNLSEGIHCIEPKIWFNLSGGPTYPGFNLSEETKRVLEIHEKNSSTYQEVQLIRGSTYRELTVCP